MFKQSNLSKTEALYLVELALKKSKQTSFDSAIPFLNSIKNYIENNRYSIKQIQSLRKIIGSCDRFLNSQKPKYKCNCEDNRNS